MRNLLRELRLAVRTLRRSPGFAVVVILTLGLGLGARTALFTVLYRVLLDPLPYPEAGRLARIHLTAPASAACV